MYTATFYEPRQKCRFWFFQVRCAHKSGDVINFTIIACRIYSRLKWYKNYKNRLAKVIVKNKMSRFYGSLCSISIIDTFWVYQHYKLLMHQDGYVYYWKSLKHVIDKLCRVHYATVIHVFMKFNTTLPSIAPVGKLYSILLDKVTTIFSVTMLFKCLLVLLSHVVSCLFTAAIIFSALYKACSAV